jgi:hypothetical protein
LFSWIGQISTQKFDTPNQISACVCAGVVLGKSLPDAPAISTKYTACRCGGEGVTLPLNFSVPVTLLCDHSGQPIKIKISCLSGPPENHVRSVHSYICERALFPADFTLKATGGSKRGAGRHIYHSCSCGGEGVTLPINFSIPVISLWDHCGQPIKIKISCLSCPAENHVRSAHGYICERALFPADFTLKATGGVSVEQAVTFIVPVAVAERE